MTKKKVSVIIEEKKKYLECTFCHNIQYESLHKDQTSAWCGKCGRCFPAMWKED